jgi:meiotically up-regulated gene 157 (Mug157) protein
VARWLGVAQGDPQGVLFVGAHSWARDIAQAIQKLGYHVLLVDSNWEHIQQARMQGLPTYYGNILAEEVEALDLNGIGRLLAMTPNDEVNSLAALHFVEVFGRSEVYQLPCQPAVRSDAVPHHLRGRLLFGEESTYMQLNTMFEDGLSMKKTAITDAFSFTDLQSHYSGKAMPMFVQDEQGNLQIYATDIPPLPKSGSTVISAVPRVEA